MDEFIWAEKYRPTTIEECILPKRIKELLNTYKNIHSRIPNLLFEGPPGNGKTSAAMALCDEVGVDWIKINASKNRGIDFLRTQIADYASSISLSGKGKCIILDEADYLTPEAQAAFRGLVEEFSSNCTFILTCNYASRLSDAIKSRMATISFKSEKSEEVDLKFAMFNKLKKMLSDEGVKYDDKAIIKIISLYFPDFRKTIGELQKHSSTGTFIFSSEENNSVETFEKLLEYIKRKDFNSCLKWVGANQEMNALSIYRKIYDGLYEYFQPHCIPQVVLLIAKYQYQHVIAPDPQVNLTAFLVELMVESTMRDK
jgi:DNA polymerase III delta prime subunit